MKTGYDIIVVAGQSNAEGFGFGDTSCVFEESPDILQLVDTYKVTITVTENGEFILDSVYPPKTAVEVAKERQEDGKTFGNLAHSFATEYIKNGYLKENRKILIIKAAVGSAGFVKHQWGENDMLPKRLYYMIDEALNMGEDSKIVAFLWHQGEQDAFENAEWDLETRHNAYCESLFTLFNNTKKRYSKDSFPFITGDFVNDWRSKHKEKCDAVTTAMEKVCEKIGSGALVSSAGLMSNDQKNGNGDDIHFCREALAELGKRYFAAFEKLTNK